MRNLTTAWRAIALATMCAAAARADEAAPPADLSGLWEGPGFDLDLPASGPGPVTNMSGDIQSPEGDYRNPILQPWAAKIVKQWADEAHAGRLPPHAHALCWPTSVPGAMTLHNGYQFLQTQDKVTIIIANQAQVRHVYLNVPHSKDVKPSWYGESVGHYEGGALVVDTVGIKPKDVIPIDRFGTPHTDKLHVIERIRKTGAKELTIEYTIEDAGAFTAPFKAVAKFHPFQNWDEEICSENNVDVTGKQVDGLPVELHPAF
jgi:hypothetical protein